MPVKWTSQDIDDIEYQTKRMKINENSDEFEVTINK